MAIVFGTFVLFFTSFAWFNQKTFFPIWWKLKGKTNEPGSAGHSMASLFGSTLVACVAQAATLALILGMYDGELTFGLGAAYGALLGAGIAAASALGHRLFGGDGYAVWAIEVGADILGLALAGAVMTFFL